MNPTAALNSAPNCQLSALQPLLRDYTRALAAMAEVEDLTALEEGGAEAA